MGKQWKRSQTLFWRGLQNHRGCWLQQRIFAPWKKSYDQMDSILKSRDVILPAKVHLVKPMVFAVVMYGWESWTIRKVECWRIDASNCGVGEDSWESLGLQGVQTSPFSGKSVLNIHWKDWCWSFNILATWCKELTHWKRPWCWERLKAEGEDRGWDGWIASPTQWTWVWASSGSWWWIGKPRVLQSMGLQRVRHELNWTDWFI